MARNAQKIGCLLACIGLLFSISACGEKTTDAVELNYDTGISGNQYNAEIFTRNEMVTWGADPGGIYVSEEQDEQYGGYYYIYITGATASYWGNYNNGYLPSEYIDNGIVGAAILCYRSKDLHSWEPAAGMVDGFSVACYSTDWEDWKSNGNCWAPEVIYDGGKYYMFYNMAAKGSSGATEVTSGGYYVGVAVSDTPVGPFRALHGTDAETGAAIPVVNFEANLDIGPHMPVIDISPFQDTDGRRYIYFKAEGDDRNTLNNGGYIYCMEMEDWETPKYDTIQLVLVPGALSVSTNAGAEAALKLEGLQTEGEIADAVDHILLEAPQCIEHEGKYYLTYSANGYTDPSYSVWQAVGDSPMGPFKKVTVEKGNPIISGIEMDYANGAGHHTFIKNGDEVFAVYHVHGNETSMESSPGRFIFTDRVHFTENGIVVNGPSNYLQWQLESVSGYRNLAPEAEVKVKGGSGEEYLTDEIIPNYDYNAAQVYESDKDITLTFTFEQPVVIRSVMIYNSRDIETAFSKVDSIEFELAEKADFMTRDYKKAVISDLKYPDMYLSDTDEYVYNPCAPAVADFNEIKVTSVTITISKESKLLTEDKEGLKNNRIDISEIVFLGGNVE